MYGGAVKVLQCILVSVVVHGYIGLGKCECLRADRLQAGGRTGACRGATVVDTVVGLNAGVDRCRGTGGARFACTCGPWTTGTIPGVTGSTGLVYQPPLWLGGQYIGRVGFMMGGLIAIDFQTSLPHRMEASLLLATKKAQGHPLKTTQHTSA